MDSKKAVIVGIPGVGKTTIVDKITNILHKKGVNTKYIVFGSVMMKEAEKIGVKDRDDMRKLPVTQQRKLQVAASIKISKMKTEVLLVDTHLFIKTHNGFWPGIPYDVATTLSPTHIFLVVAKSEEIIKRRLKDVSRSRDPITESEVLEELEIAKNMLSCLAVMTGATIMHIQNTEGKADKAALIAAAALGVN